MIPGFTLSGILPPFVGSDPTVRAGNSPYVASMSEVVNRFATSIPRIDILKGLLAYREQLRLIGVASGFQWLDGSFVENSEVTRGQPPGDLDLVTFAARPTSDISNWNALINSRLDLFDPLQAKSKYKCDAYFVDLLKRPDLIVTDTAYWHGLFGHQRATAMWKGLLVVPIVSDDALAQSMV
jgi:hypothetical protein